LLRPAAYARQVLIWGVVALVSAAGGKAAETGRADLVNREILRVCSDPANLPFSNEARQGFENKIAELVADELKLPLEYTWFPQATGFVRQTLFAKRCDLIIGFAQGDDLVLNTNHYYRSSYALVHRRGQGLDGADALADERLKAKRIGIVAGTPPGNIMAMLGLMQRKTIPPDGRPALRVPHGADDRRYPLRRNRCRDFMGADRRLFRQPRRRSFDGDAAVEGDDRAAHGLPDHVRRAQSGG
jgi:hypothetical protein